MTFTPPIRKAAPSWAVPRRGVAAFTMAWFHPERYHKVLSYSGTFVNQAWPPDPKTPRGGMGVS